MTDYDEATIIAVMNADWTSFYLAIAGAAATLLGLLFIAVQFNIESLTSDPSNRWRAVARSTFTIHVVLFLLPLIFLNSIIIR